MSEVSDGESDVDLDLEDSYIPSGDEEELSEHTSACELSCDEEVESAVTVIGGDVGSTTRQDNLAGSNTSLSSPRTFYRGKHFVWESEPIQPINSRSSKNIIKIKTSTLKGPAKNLINPSPEEV